VSDPDAPPLQAADVLQLLDRHAVRYVVVGGLAATVHGAARVTFDIDLVPEWTDDNLGRLAAALREADAELHTTGVKDPVPYSIDAQSLRQFEVSTWRTRLGDLDVIRGTPKGWRGALAGYEELRSRAHRREAFGVPILVADLDDVIESKQALAREPDLVALPELHRLRERLRRSDPDS
jgi:hypothetical protein